MSATPQDPTPTVDGSAGPVLTGPSETPYDAAASSLAGHVQDSVMAELLSIRSSIDNIDATLVFLLAERFKATQKVGFLKAEHRLPAGDPGREAAQISRLRRLAGEAHLDPAFAEKFLNFIIGEVIRHHEAIAEGLPVPGDIQPGVVGTES
ncbi:chorismate mutase [Pseudarthrobacter sp. PS3-L1]|uniref:chorismate mutase n=1 Tax=Pseudarthrobacter sp. PS3-L1 TaxID=3046207 RepID=UPI0024BA0BE7|nr:chorismate mutase [Pseudarthrobacter sp. PS3-L1]MDJ0321476.1 chorismate mutase [Pseudarthrobacter sp. PS3-L1]